jgi:hypothetical protein
VYKVTDFHKVIKDAKMAKTAREGRVQRSRVDIARTLYTRIKTKASQNLQQA